MGAYYNEIDPYAAAWLRNLIAAGHIAPGDVDERDIQDVQPEDLRGYSQHHFFAGVGVWSLALRRAGWADDRPVWTGSCPCQPFSQAGKGLAFADERHLWPAWYHLISECRPAVVLGEQVASNNADAWIDLVQDDMEAVGHAFGAVPFPSAGVGAPHVRDRLYWVAYADGSRSRRYSRAVRRAKAEINREGSEDGGKPDGFELGRTNGRLAHSLPAGRTEGRPVAGHRPPSGLCVVGGLGHAEREGLALGQRLARVPGAASGTDPRQATERAGIHVAAGPGPTNGLWRDADWLLCRDGRWRPVEPGAFPLAYGAPARVGRLRAYGNAINAEAARVFIEHVMEWLSSQPLATAACGIPSHFLLEKKS
ncbi:DNA cytosine methyltransferase [Ralstonia pseudosolanacearum]|uniref:Putative phage methyltransferase protein n=1 Tax=Ralstonia solanacearum TaxID=305 RepID=A0A0S4UA30_RALSL|nr:DNA cytosine methyltransferase [Ralstonia pseudosolanacearum]MCK4139391.1 DNA cytosine methyltransferase [Ralstonia pseudosolanacearum]CUV19063.1 putative phage methyltransferase protein [Ralstonia solanacearum]